MRSAFMPVLTLGIILISQLSLAQPPVTVNYNVHVLQNATPQQCKAYKGRVGPAENVDTFTRFGQGTGMTGPGIRSCVACTVDSKTQDCVCKKCYNYYN